MEQNVQVIGKRLWHVVRVALYMLRKSINKKKLLLDLKYLTMKRRPKLTGKSTHHRTHGDAYDFHVSKRAHHDSHWSSHAPIYDAKESELDAVSRVLDMAVCQNGDVEGSPLPYFYSPVLPGFGFGPSPVVRVTDSPYLLEGQNGNLNDSRVDEAAEEFIQRFYNQLRHQQMIVAGA